MFLEGDGENRVESVCAALSHNHLKPSLVLASVV